MFTSIEWMAAEVRILNRTLCKRDGMERLTFFVIHIDKREEITFYK